jgi:hypothetical protein
MWNKPWRLGLMVLTFGLLFGGWGCIYLVLLPIKGGEGEAVAFVGWLLLCSALGNGLARFGERKGLDGEKEEP